MRMIRWAPCPLMIFVMIMAYLPHAHSQDSVALPSQNELKIRERTILAQFESEMVLSADDRLQKKLERRELILKRQAMIDTLDISERRRRRLLKELYNSPLSDRWERLVAKMQFEEDPDWDQ